MVGREFKGSSGGVLTRLGTDKGGRVVPIGKADSGKEQGCFVLCRNPVSAELKQHK